MKKRLIAAALAALMMLALAACGGETAAGPSQAPDPAPSASALPDKGTPPPAEVTPSAEPVSTAAPALSDAPAASDAPVSDPAAPEETPVPTLEPSPEPVQTPAAAITAQEVFDAIAQVIPSTGSVMDASFAVDSFYSLDPNDLEDFIFCMPAMNSTVTEFFIAKVKSGKMDAVKDACLGRHADMAAEGQQYAANAVLVDSYKLVTNGDWVLFCVCEDPDQAVSAFKNVTN